MTDLAMPRQRAVEHMRGAMALLEEAREGVAAAYLQAAIDAAERARPLQPGDELPDAGTASRLAPSVRRDRRVDGAPGHHAG